MRESAPDMATKLLQERFAFAGGKVDRTGPYPVLREVLLCGATSANRRRYKREAFAGDRVKLYEGRPVYIDHGDPRVPRSYRDKVGVIENARLRADGLPVGDIAVNPEQAVAKQFLWDAEHKPTSCGMSHVARCEAKAGADGWDEVEQILEVKSVDVVVEPATMPNGLAEQTGGIAVKFTVKQLAEWVAKHPQSTTKQTLKIKALAEDGYADVPAMDAEPAPDGDVDDGITEAFKSAILSVVEKALSGDLDPKEALAKIKTLMNSHGDATDAGKGKGGGDSPADTPADESKKPADPFAVLAECRKEGYEPGASTLKALCAMDPTDRAAFVLEQKAARPAESPRSGGRAPGSGTVTPGRRTQEQKGPEVKDAKSFVEAITQ